MHVLFFLLPSSLLVNILYVGYLISSVFLEAEKERRKGLRPTNFSYSVGCVLEIAKPNMITMQQVFMVGNQACSMWHSNHNLEDL